MIGRVRFMGFIVAVSFFFKMTSGISSEIVFSTSGEIYDYVYGAVENISISTEEILRIPADAQTFENTFKTWHRLKNKISSVENTLTSVEYPQIIHEFQSEMQTRVFQNIALQSALLSYAERALHNETLNPYQRHIVECFIENSYGHHFNQPIYVHLAGNAIEKSGKEETFTILNLNVKHASEVSVGSLLEQILSEDADAVCLQEVAIDVAHDIFDSLNKHYAHFYITTDEQGFLIASKYAMEDPQHSIFNNHEFLNFVIKNEDCPLAHLYVTQLQSSSSKKSGEVGKMQVQKILESMESDSRRDLPILLCGDARNASDEIIGAIERQSYTALRGKKEFQGMIMLCEANEGNDNNWVDLSARGERDGKGNEKIEGGVGYGNDGFSASVRGHVGRDSNGNISYGAEARVGWEIGGSDRGSRDRAERARERQERERVDIEREDRK